MVNPPLLALRFSLGGGLLAGFLRGLVLAFRRRFFECRIESAEGFPCWRVLGRRKFFNRDIFYLNECHTSPVDLWGDDTIKCDVGIYLGIVGGENIVDPHLDACPLSADPVFVPAEGIDGFLERRFIDGQGDGLSAAVLIVDFSEPIIPAVDLVTGHAFSLREADTANLDATVYKPGFRISTAFDFQFQLKILEALFGGDEIVCLDVFRGGAAGDCSVFHSPDLGIVFPAFQGFPIEESDGFRK